MEIVIFKRRGIIILTFFRCSLLLRACSRHFLTTCLNCLSDCKDLRTFPLYYVILCGVQRSGKVHFFFFVQLSIKRSFIFSTRYSFYSVISLVVTVASSFFKINIRFTVRFTNVIILFIEMQ